jgi:KEOPS complex subunit Cgi121
MRCVIEEYVRIVEIIGYRNVAFYNVEAFLKANRKLTKQNVDIQFFDAELIATWEHLYFSVLNALQAFRTQTNISKSVAVEAMLYAAAKRQIQKAIDTVGVKSESETVAAVIVGATPEQVDCALQELTAYLGAEPDDSVLELTVQKEKKIRVAFKIGDKEIEVATKTTVQAALVDLVVEHVALLATQQ